MVLGVIPFVVDVWLSKIRVSSAGLGRRPGRTRLNVAGARIGTHLHRLVRPGSTFLVLAVSSGGFSGEVGFGRDLLKNGRGALPARRPRLGAVDGGGGATRIT